MNTNDHNEILAQELASRLNDEAHLSLYRKFVQKLPVDVLKRILSEVTAVPTEKIRKSRGALFTYLVQRYVHKKQRDHRD